MAAPTLETNADASILRILAGIEGDPVTWNDVWDWDDGGGSSGGDGDVPKDGGGTAKVSTFMTETVADAVYQILDNKIIWYGNGSTPSYFRSIQEQIYFGINAFDIVTGSATKDMIGSCYRYSNPPTSRVYSDSGSVWNIRECLIIFGSTGLSHYFRNSGTWKNTVFQNDPNGNGTATLYFYNADLIMDRLTLYGFNIALVALTVFNTDPNDIGIFSSNYGIQGEAVGSKFVNVSLNNIQVAELRTWGAITTFEVIDSVGAISTVYISHDGAWICEQYTFNLHIRDKDGANLAGVTCLLEDTDGTQVFSVETAADGTITEQTVDYKKWEGTDETLTEYTPHKLTVSKTNYETLVIDNITMDEKKSLELELLPALSVADVTEGTVFGENKTGTFIRNAVSGAVVTGQGTAGIVTGQSTVGVVVGE